jgi:hypothetical protein
VREHAAVAFGQNLGTLEVLDGDRLKLEPPAD